MSDAVVSAPELNYPDANYYVMRRTLGGCVSWLFVVDERHQPVYVIWSADFNHAIGFRTFTEAQRVADVVQASGVMMYFRTDT